jgi:hypothetical protein
MNQEDINITKHTTQAHTHTLSYPLVCVAKVSSAILRSRTGTMLGIPLAHAAVTASFMASASTPLQPSAMILRAPRPLAVDDGVEPLKTWRQALAKRRAEALQTAPALPAAQERAIVPSSSGTQADKALTWRQALAAKRTEALRSSGLAALPSAQPSAMVPV